MERAEIMEMLWAAAEPKVFVPKEAYLGNFADWDVAVHDVGGIPSFITVQNGPEFHFESLGTGAQITRSMIADFLEPIITKHGFAATKTPIHDERQQRFNRILGFEVVGQDEYDIHYRISRVRGLKCH